MAKHITHREHFEAQAPSLSAICGPWHMTFGLRCLNCGWVDEQTLEVYRANRTPADTKVDKSTFPPIVGGLD